MRSIAVIPTYEEAPNVLRLAADVFAHAPELDIVVVDDASPDGTADLVAGEMEHESRLHLVRRAGKLGLGTAYLAGFRYALDHGYEWVLTMDGDFSHDPRHLPDMLRAAREHDLVIGSRYVRGGGISNWPLRRRALSRFANLYTRTLLRLPVRDCTSGFRCYHRRVLLPTDAFGMRTSGYAFLEEMVYRVHACGFRIAEIPIVFEDRVRGRSKIDPSEIWRAAWHVFSTAVHPPRMPATALEANP